MIPDLVTKSVHRMSTSGGDHGANFFSITGHLMSRSLDSGSFFMVLQLVSGGDMVMTRVYKFHREKYEIDDNFTTFCKNYYQILLSSMSCT